ncbi:MAG TPA: FkbM family methyltransferase [Bryobacteraceae bacterium]|nr:FkbM family methyltransferase [Bryobacteraceae bacterium]
MTARLKEAIRHLLPARRKVHRIRSGPLAGYLIHTSWHDYPGAIRGNTETKLLEWFRQNVRPGETWLDVGAHYGYTAIALSRLVGRNGRVIAFEPVLSTADSLECTREVNGLEQLKIVPLGLSSGSDAGVRRMAVHRGMAEASLSNSASSEPVTTAGFDRVWESLCAADPAIHGVKIDVQGMEGLVLAGMTGALRRWKPRLVIEFHPGVERGAILDLLEGCGYDRHPEALENSSGGIKDDKSYAFVPVR